METNAGVKWVIKNNNGDVLKEYTTTDEADQVCQVEEDALGSSVNHLLEAADDNDKLEVALNQVVPEPDSKMGSYQP